MIGLESGGNSARERAVQAVHYYNNKVLKAKNNNNWKCSSSELQGNERVTKKDILHRSNSSLELLPKDGNQSKQDNLAKRPTSLKREYGSHGSIDIISDESINSKTTSNSEQFFAMLQDYRPAVFDISSKNNNKKRGEYFMTNKETVIINDGMANDLQDDCVDKPTTTSPKQKLKFHRFWGGNLSGIKHSLSADSSAGLSLSYDTNVTNNVTASTPDLDEKHGRRAFAHYDCQSVTTKLFGNKLTNLLSKRRNTTTGASAASSGRSSTPDGDCIDDDNGDGRSNELIQSCPFFRNEIGGEEERIVSLTGNYSPTRGRQATDPHHRPALSGGVSILEYPPGQTHWIGDICPYTRNANRIENVDQGALYYRQYFYKQEHQNWFGMDENLGPVAISIKRETLDSVSAHPDNTTTTPPASLPLVRYRLIVRTSELQALRGSVLEDSIPNIRSSSSSKNVNTKEVIEHVIPEVQLSSLRLGINSTQTEEQLLKLDEQGISRNYKVGVLYCKAGQSTEEEMYNNEEAGPAFLEFLETIGQRVRLKGFDKYKAGLDNKSDSTGLYSVFAQHKDYQLMFHVSTFLPFTPNNRQQLLRKRHIGNDIVTIVFQEPGAEPFTPKHIRSQFQHVFIIVQAINPCTDNTRYKIAVTRSKEVALFGPPILKGGVFNKSQHFTDFLLTKVINGENSAHLSDKFATMATRTRQAYLKDLSSNCSSNTLLETTQKFSMLSFSNKKKERWKPRFAPDASQRGAICWQVMLEDSTNSTIIHCYLAISTDSLVLIDENTDNIVFVTPCKSILGWSTQTNSLRLYYHEGECITIHMKESGDRDELMEVVVRLRASTEGTAAQELALRRNPIGQLGFHVQPDGVVTQVENMGLAFQAGLRQGARLVEICKVAVATLTHDQMVDLLKTSLMVTVNVIPPISDGTPRRGCMIQNCRYNLNRFEGDYGDSSSPHDKINSQTTSAAYQQPVSGNHRKLYDRSFSPPKSSNSSGYGTGSSSKSFSSIEHKKYSNDHHEMVPSLPSGPCSDDRWYDALESESTAGNPTCSSSNSLFKSNLYSKSKSNPDNANSSYSLPNITGHTNSPEYSNRISPQDDKVTCIIKAERSHEVRRQLEQRTAQHFSLKNHDTNDRYPVDSITNAVRGLQIIADDRSTDSSISERAFPPSEDELSIESGSNGSPRTVGARRTGSAHLTASSSGSSRNQSPRLKDTGEPRLRAGASTSRSSNRSSTNLSSSTLQQDLMKLINPDYATTEKGSSEISKYFASGMNMDQKKMKEKNKQVGSNNKSRKNKLDNNIDKVIVTTARPATVISNGSSSPSEHKLSMEERLSPRVTNIIPNMKRQSPCLPLPDDKEMDWSSLVDTATKAMLQVSNVEDQVQTVYSSLNPESEDDNIQEWFDEPQGAQMSNLKNEKGMQEEFQKYLSELENRLMKETQKRLSLEEEVSGLRDENRRLQQESQSAAQQLRRFTEWFFQTIDKE